MSAWHSAQVLDPTKVAPGICGGAMTVRLIVEQEITTAAAKRHEQRSAAFVRWAQVHDLILPKTFRAVFGRVLMSLRKLSRSEMTFVTS
jgi:hypothetical protein